MSSPAPTFQNNRDRLTYLLAEYKVLVGGMAIAAVLLVAYYQPQAPTLPTWIPALLVGWLVLAIPCFLVGRKIAVWLRNRRWIQVHHVNAAEDVVEKHNVPPEIWQNKTVEGPDPTPSTAGPHGPFASTSGSTTSKSCASAVCGSKAARIPNS